MFSRRFGQYDIADVEALGGDPWTGSIYDPGMTPSVYVTQQPSSGTSILSGLLPSLISGISQVGSAYLGYQTAKEKSTTPTVATARPTAVTTTQQATGATSPLGGMSLTTIGLIAAGAFLILRKKKRGR